MAYKREDLKIVHHRTMANGDVPTTDFEVVERFTAKSLYRGRGFVAGSDGIGAAEAVALRILCAEPAPNRPAIRRR